MVRRLCILCFLLALWPGLALAQSPALKEAQKQYTVHLRQGRFAAAEPFASEALGLAEKEFRADDPWTRHYLYDAIVNLAVLYRAQGRHAEAEPLFERALAIQENVFGPDHPGAATPRPSRLKSAPCEEKWGRTGF